MKLFTVSEFNIFQFKKINKIYKRGHWKIFFKKNLQTAVLHRCFITTSIENSHTYWKYISLKLRWINTCTLSSQELLALNWMTHGSQHKQNEITCKALPKQVFLRAAALFKRCVSYAGWLRPWCILLGLGFKSMLCQSRCKWSTARVSI